VTICRTQRHRGHCDCAGLHHGEPARAQQRVVRRAEKHPVSRHDAEIAHQNVRNTIRVGEKSTVSDLLVPKIERNTIAVALGDRVIEESRAAVQLLRKYKLRPIKQEFRPFISWRQLVPREGIDVRSVGVHGLGVSVGNPIGIVATAEYLVVTAAFDCNRVRSRALPRI